MSENQQLGNGRREASSSPVPGTTTGVPVTQPYLHQQASQLHTSHTSTTTTVLNIEINNPQPPVLIEERTDVYVVKTRWTCCGMGYGWFLFVLGWFLCGIPWFAGFFILICGSFDRQERSGLLACATFAIVISVIATINAIKEHHH